MRFLIVLLIVFSTTGCNLIPHQYKSSDELVRNFIDTKSFEFDGNFNEVFPALISSAEQCGKIFRQKDIDVGGAAAASNYDVQIKQKTDDSARIEIWSVHFIDTYLYEVIDVKATGNITTATHYQLNDVHAGNKFRVEDISSWYGNTEITCE